MDLNTCYATTASMRDLALYSHLIPASAIILLASFVLWKAINRLKARAFASFCAAFSLWLLSDLVLWTSNNYHLVAALWAPIDFVEIIFFLLLFEFICIDFFPKKRPQWITPFILAAAAVPFLTTITGQSVSGLNQPVCEMLNNEFIQNYKLVLEAFILSAILYFGVRSVIAAKERMERIRVALVVASVILFLGIFAVSEYMASYTAVYEIELYSFFTLPVFVLFLTMAITSYGTFKLGDAAVKMLFYVFLVLAATQFFSVQDITDFLLALMSFGVVLTLGVMLFRVSEREIHQRELIQKQEMELEEVNKQQEGLLHFISHEIKGYLAKSEAGFAAIMEGDYGEVSAPLRQMAEGALADTRKGVDTVMDILDASNLKKGTVAYDKKNFDFLSAIQDVVNSLKPMAQEKQISLEFTTSAAVPVIVNGDENKLRHHVIRNLIDNSIRYTPSGSVNVDLTIVSGSQTARMTVADTGVGISQEDMKKIFTEGGKGADSIKVNVHSTGYGLYIAKSIAEAHGGKIWAESEGKNRGSRFIVELPAV